MRNKTGRYVFGLVLAMALASMTMIARSSYAQRDNDVTRQELENFDRFLDSHAQIRSDLTRNPNLINDSRYLQDHPELREFMASHNGVREELRENPGAFMHRENSAEGSYGAPYGGGGRPGGGGYYRDEDQPHMEAAMQHLRQAEEELGRRTHDKGGHRVKAMELVRQAESEVNTGIHWDDTHPGDRR